MKTLLLLPLTLLIFATSQSCSEPDENNEYLITVSADSPTSFGIVQVLDGVVGGEQQLNTPYEATIDSDVSYLVFRSADPGTEIKVQAGRSGGGGVTGQSSVVVIYANGEKMTTVAM